MAEIVSQETQHTAKMLGLLGLGVLTFGIVFGSMNAIARGR